MTDRVLMEWRPTGQFARLVAMVADWRRRDDFKR